MPYIDPLNREELESIFFKNVEEIPFYQLEPGELNFLITTFIYRWLGDDFRYTDINTALGVLEAAKLELYRRVAAPYEDKKIAENGDVYGSP